MTFTWMLWHTTQLANEAEALGYARIATLLHQERQRTGSPQQLELSIELPDDYGAVMVQARDALLARNQRGGQPAST